MRDRNKIKTKHSFELDNKQMIYVFAGFIVACLFVFVAGTMLGSKMSAKKEEPVKEENKLRAKIKAPSLLEEKKVETVKTVKVTEEKPKQTPPAPKAAAETPAKTIEDIIEKELKKDAPVVVAGKVASEPKKATAVSVTAAQKSLSASGKEAFFVQVASFQKSEDAEKQASKIKAKGYKVVIIKADLAEKGTWYRVRLGPYSDSAAAKSDALKYEKSEKVTTFVTKGLI